jgi:hypothetical protein
MVCTLTGVFGVFAGPVAHHRRMMCSRRRFSLFLPFSLRIIRR